MDLRDRFITAEQAEVIFNIGLHTWLWLFVCNSVFITTFLFHLVFSFDWALITEWWMKMCVALSLQALLTMFNMMMSIIRNH